MYHSSESRSTRMTIALRISGVQRAIGMSSSGRKAVFVADDLRLRALAGDATAQAEYGQRLLCGNGVARNKRDGRQWCRRAAEQGNALGQFLLGSCYYNGEGGLTDHLLAFMWFCLASDQGLREAQIIRRLLAGALGDARLREAKRMAAAWRPTAASGKSNNNGGSKH